MRKGMANRFIWILSLLLIVWTGNASARQVEGRPTLPSDCWKSEVWVRGHPKTTGIWTAFCRTRDGDKSSPAYYFIAPKFKPGPPEKWPFDDEHPTEWQAKDVADVLWSIEHIPEALWDRQIRGIYRLARSMDYPNPGLYRGGHIILYDTAFQNEEYTARVLAHELAHARFTRFSKAQRLEYLKTTGWGSHSRQYVKEDCRESVDEDFANSAEFFVFQPETLKAASPRAYMWMEKFLGGSSRRKK